MGQLGACADTEGQVEAQQANSERVKTIIDMQRSAVTSTGKQRWMEPTSNKHETYRYHSTIGGDKSRYGETRGVTLAKREPRSN